MLVRSLVVKSRKRLTSGVFDSLATHHCLVYNITDTDCWAQRLCFQSRLSNRWVGGSGSGDDGARWGWGGGGV